MEIGLLIFLGAALLAFLLAPFWMGAAPLRAAKNEARWHSLEALELDRELGKISDEEFRELKKQTCPTRVLNLENLIFRARREKRLQLALEAEILVARARGKR